MSHPSPSSSLIHNPLLGHWIDFRENGCVRVLTGKVEVGQGIITAIAQIAAEELRLPATRIKVVSGDTRICPNENFTSGSLSIALGGAAVRTACAEARRALLEQAAKTLDCYQERLTVHDGSFLLDHAPSGLDYWQIASRLDLSRPLPAPSAWEDASALTIVGRSIPRVDLPGKLFGGAFIHDVELPGMLHGRVLRPPSVAAQLTALDEAAVCTLPGVVALWRSGAFVGVCCDREDQAVEAWRALRQAAEWSEDEAEPAPREWRSWLALQPTIDEVSELGRASRFNGAAHTLTATYSRPVLAHAPIGPSCAVARFEDGCLTVWTSSGGVFPLRTALADVLGWENDRIAVIHVQGAGAYGHTGSDDAALDAALLAREVTPRPVRVQWMREDEFTWSPAGSPMAVHMRGTVDARGRITDWAIDIWSGQHVQRPGLSGAVNLLAAAHIDPPLPFHDPHTAPVAFVGADRNAKPLYDLPRQRITLHKTPGLGLRLSSLRSLGAYANVFAIESFMDELAQAAGVDPVEFRLRHLSDSRARRVIESVARMSRRRRDADRKAVSASGLAMSRYKNSAAYVAIVADVIVEDAVRVSQVYCAVDAGLVINPDGLLNQIEGGIVQSISWTLKEELAVGERGVAARSWEDYPILRFDETPEIDVEVMSADGNPPLGVGEAAQGPTAAAVANGLARALGVRIRDLPLTRQRILDAT